MARTKSSLGMVPAESVWRPYWLEPNGPVAWSEVFGNDHPVEVEIGSGKGLFLVSAAQRVPQHNFLGIDIARKFAIHCAGQLAQNALGNARIARADARRVFAEWVLPASVTAVHVYFPDPWWKRRHKKRRILSPLSLSHIARALVRGGELRVASDVVQYFHEIQTTVASHGGFELLELPAFRDPEYDQDYLTNFERKYRKAGKPI